MKTEISLKPIGRSALTSTRNPEKCAESQKKFNNKYALVSEKPAKILPK